MGLVQSAWVENNLVRKNSKILFYRLGAKNTKKKELGTAHHNDASPTGYLITVTLHQNNNFKRQP